MTPERWQQIDKLLGRAVEHEPGQRAAFLDEACAGDAELRREVESLLIYHTKAEQLLNRPALDLTAEKLAAEPPSLLGQSLGPYQIQSLLGAGGMGEVYKARDTRLNRTVAIKAVPRSLSDRADLRRRFVQEAKAASALNHPNIITIYDILNDNGRDFIVMEYVEGKTLDQLIPRRGMKLNEVLKYAIQIADALAKAQAAGIIHRDLKPGNMMVGEGGLVKVLDFGLAKLTERLQIGEEESTRSIPPWTDEGTILGTASYMSPEQAAGKPVDARSDIFSFGSVLYEMVTGQRAFQGDSKMSILAAVLNREPKPASEISTALPQDLGKIITRCLRKDPNRRFQHMADLKVALEELKQESDSGLLGIKEGIDSSGKPTRVSLLRWVTLAVAGVSLAVAAWFWFSRSTTGQPEGVLTAVPLTTYPGHERSPSFSPDGNQVAFSWNGERQDNFDIYVKLIGAGRPLRLTTHPAEDSGPAWSPDGRWIAFLRDLGEERAAVLLVPPIGGQEKKLGEIRKPFFFFIGFPITWSPEGDSLVVVDKEADDGPYALFVLSIESGEKRKLTSPPASSRGDSSPAFSPDGRSIAFARTVEYGFADLYLLTLGMGLKPVAEPRKLTSGRSLANVAWAPGGREIIFSSGYPGSGSLWRVAVAESGQAQGLAVGENGFDLSVSREKRRLVYSRAVSDTNIWRVKVSNSPAKATMAERFISSTWDDSNPQFSPDGKRVAFSSKRSGANQIWVCDSDGSNPMQLTSFGNGDTGSPRWSPDSRWVSFDSNAEGQYEAYVVDSNGSKPRRLTTNPGVDAVPSWSRDGKWIYFGSNRNGTYQVWKMSASGGNPTQITRNGGYVPFESVDGKVVFYTKGFEDNRVWEVPSQGGEETEVLGPILWRNFAVAKDGIYFIPYPRSEKDYVIRFLSFATKRIRSIASVENPTFNDLSVSPDGRWILYPKLESEGSDLMLVENFR